MHAQLAAIPVSGMINPGDIYIICAEKDLGWDPGPIELMYVITRDEDILPALEMEICIFLGQCYELRQFIKCSEILEDCYEFRFRCIDKAENREVGYSLFLHRLSSFSEKLAWAKEIAN